MINYPTPANDNGPLGRIYTFNEAAFGAARQQAFFSKDH